MIDGVAINGVSGGPVAVMSEKWGTRIIGSITAYFANRTADETLPGLSIAQDVSHLHETASAIRSIDEARKAVIAAKAVQE